MHDNAGSRPRILVTGSSGQLGWELRRSFSSLGEVVATVGPGERRGRALDLADPGAIRRTMAEVQPRVVLNAAAYTAVDRAEEEPEVADAINGRAPEVLAEEARHHGALLVHFSTDYVFDGGLERPYRVDDPAAPVNRYGQSKLRGEQAIEAAGGRYLILRTSWLYGARGNNFLRTILRRADDGRALRVVADQHGAPTWARSVAEGTAQIVAQSRLMPADWLAEKSGTYHMTAAGCCSWFEFARAILESRGDGAVLPELVPIPSSEYPVAAARPPRSILDCGKLRATFGIELGPWRELLAHVMEEIREHNGP